MKETVFIGDDAAVSTMQPALQQRGMGSGDFELTELLSDSGGMALVYLAFQKSFGRRVVAKQLRSEFGANRESKACQAFRDEGRKMASLGAHPNIVQVYYYDDASLTLYMEFIQGATLDACIAAQGSPPPDQAVMIALAVLDGLSFMHKKDIIHLDIKPANIFILGPGRIKISDFGIASSSARTIRSGTPGYCSPEQAIGAPVGPYSDVYATATLLFELLAGHNPFPSLSMEAYASDLRANPLPDVRSRLPWLSDGMCSVLQKAMAYASGHRFQTAQEFRDALDRAWAAHVAILEIKGAESTLGQTSWLKRLRAAEALQHRAASVVDVCPEDQGAKDLHERISRCSKRLRQQRLVLLGVSAAIFSTAIAGATVYFKKAPAEIAISMDERVRGEANVSINGRLIGQVSSGKKEIFLLPAGRHEISLSVPGVIAVEPKTVVRDLEAGKEGEPIIYSPPVAYVLVVSPGNSNADCIVDGINTGYKSPCSFNLAFGEHTFTVGNSTLKKEIFSSSAEAIRVELP